MGRATQIRPESGRALVFFLRPVAQPTGLVLDGPNGPNASGPDGPDVDGLGGLLPFLSHAPPNSSSYYMILFVVQIKY